MNKQSSHYSPAWITRLDAAPWRHFFLWPVLALSLILSSACNDSSSSSSSGNGPGTGGSTARMTLSGDYLYAISGQDVQLFDTRSAATPNPWVKIRVDWNIETLFPYGDYILIGAADGMRIMDNTNPASPTYINFPHANAQDPVVAENGYAYVTLRSENGSPNGVNELNIVDINDINNPFLINTVAMQHPSGLSIDGSKLFICDGIAGLKIFDVTDRQNLQTLEYLPDVICNDVIAKNNILYVLTDNRLLQYDYTTSPPTPLSEVRP